MSFKCATRYRKCNWFRALHSSIRGKNILEYIGWTFLLVGLCFNLYIRCNMKINFKTQRLLKAKRQEKKEFVLISVVFFVINDFYRCSVSITTNLSYEMLYIVYNIKLILKFLLPWPSNVFQWHINTFKQWLFATMQVY